MKRIKAIETHYAGRRFRSRREARWAVFFSKIGLSWEYEPEGFELPSGRYLPDFWLVELDTWVEIKGKRPTKEEIKLACELSEAVGKDVNIFYTDFERDADNLLIAWAVRCRHTGDEDGPLITDRCSWAMCSECCQIRSVLFADPDVLPCKDRTCGFNTRSSIHFFQHAYRAAASARFEFGEEG